MTEPHSIPPHSSPSLPQGPEYPGITDHLRPNPSADLPRSWVGDFWTRFGTHPGDHAALDHAAHRWTYTQVRTAVDQLAAAFVRLGCRPAAPIALLASRKPELPIALLAALRSGCPFVILDPSHPPDRIQRCLRLARPQLLLNLGDPSPSHPLPQDLPVASLTLSHPGGPILFDQTPLPDADSQSNPTPETAYESPLYTAFTSGTTAEPRIIQGALGPVVHFFQRQCELHELNSSDRVSVLSGLAHDPLLRDLLMPLWIGATVCFPPSDFRQTPGSLRSWMRSASITVTHLTPPLAQVLLAGASAGEPPALPNLRAAFFGGDRLTYGLARRLHRAAPACRIINGYGTTETPQIMAWYRIPDTELTSSTPSDSDPVPIGTGIPECQILLLDPHLALCPINQEGDLFVRTRHRALSVHDPSGLRSEPYLQNPARTDPTDLLYRTGDRAVYRSDGQVHLRGRNDRQVKIRGFRVQLEEIESGFLKIPSVAAAAVCHTRSEDGRDSLSAYIVGSNESPLDLPTLRQELGRMLPDYMIPDAIVESRMLPMTPNGKVDYAAVGLLHQPAPRPNPVPPASAPPETAPAQLAKTFATILGTHSVREDTLISELAISSIDIIELTCAIEQAHGKTLTPGDILSQHSITSLARLLSGSAPPPSPPPPNPASIPTAPYQGPALAPRGENLLRGIANRILQVLARVAPDVWRVKLHRARGVQIGQATSVGYDSIIETSYPWLVKIGDCVNLGMRTTVIGHFRGMATADQTHPSVIIENDAFVGPGVIILPNVTIGQGAVVGAGSVVTESVPPLTFVQGVPAKPKAICGIPLSRKTTYDEFKAALRPLS